jgi:hypothetical protein
VIVYGYLDGMQVKAAPSSARPLALGLLEKRFVFSTSHKKNFKKPFLAHIGTRGENGINFFPLCGRLLNGPTSSHLNPPANKKICPRCARRHAKEFGEELPK